MPAGETVAPRNGLAAWRDGAAVNRHGALASLALLGANLRLGVLLSRAQTPPAVWLIGRLLPEVVRMLVYVLVGYLVAGAEGMRFALVGCVVLAVATTTVAEVTDLPTIDVEVGTYRRVLLGRISPFLQYVVRAVPMAALALLTAAICAVALGLATGHPEEIGPLLARIWLLVPAATSGVMLGLFVIAPAIGSGWEGITYNAATALLAVASSAIVTPPAALAAVGQALPLTHTVEAMRRSLAGEPFGRQLLAELAVGLGWGILAWLAYRWQERRGRRLARGAFAA